MMYNQQIVTLSLEFIKTIHSIFLKADYSNLIIINNSSKLINMKFFCYPQITKSSVSIFPNNMALMLRTAYVSIKI